MTAAEGPQSPAAPQDAPAESTENKEPDARADLLFSPHPAVPPPADSCATSEPPTEVIACPDAPQRLSSAVRQEGDARDAALAELEQCSNYPVGLVRALRAELGDAACADVLVAPLVGHQAGSLVDSAPLRETLVALGLGARLRRLAVEPPAAPEERDAPTLQAYFAEVLFPWIEQQASAIYAMARQGKELTGYAKGIVAIEAGNADMRFVEIVRDAPVAENILAVPEARDVYYATLDETLEPRKSRGTAAALVGLREMARVGVRRSERVASARALLGRAYGGRRIDALDFLLLPDLPPVPAGSDAEVIAAHVPTPYAGALVPRSELTAGLLRAHLAQGLPVALRREVQSLDAPQLDLLLLLARGLFEQGRTYFRAEDFQDATQLAHRAMESTVGQEQNAADSGSPSSTSRKERAPLLRALSSALMAGPQDAAELLAGGPRFGEQPGNWVFLDALAEKPGETGGRAAFNAAFLRELVVRPGDPEAWADLAQRYASAASRLKGDEARWARERASACRQIEREVRASSPGASTR